MKKSLTLLSLFAAVSMTFYQCGGGTDTPTTTTDSGAQQEAVKPAPAPAEESTDIGSGAALASGGIGKWDKEDWYSTKTIWVTNQSEFDLKDGDVDGKPTLRANAKVADNRVRDLFIAKKVDGLEGGKSYKISLNYKFDSEKPGIQANADEDQFMKVQNMKAFNYIQYDMKDGDQAKRSPISQIEDYPEHPVETTKYADAATIGDGAYHTIEITHTVGAAETSATLMMIVRFRAETDVNANWLYLQDFKVEPAS